MDVLLSLAIVALLVWFWLDGTRSREFTTQHCNAFSDDNRVQFLDQSIHQSKMRFARGRSGRIGLRRFYVFEFSINGADRYIGVAVEFGNRIEYLSLLHPQGEIIKGDPSLVGLSKH